MNGSNETGQHTMPVDGAQDMLASYQCKTGTAATSVKWLKDARTQNFTLSFEAQTNAAIASLAKN